MQGFKTFLFGLALLLLGGAESVEFTNFISENAGAYSAAIGTLVIVLRAITKTPIFKKED